jgi:hypothetical protein
VRTSVTIELSLPERALCPNTPRVHWAAKAKARKKAREAAHLAALDACGIDRPRWKSATVQATFYLRDRRGLEADQDNRIGSLKAHIDGIADAGVLENDRGLTWKPVAHDVDRKRPRVVLVFTEGQP